MNRPVANPCASPFWLQMTEGGLEVWPPGATLPEGLRIENEEACATIALTKNHCLALCPLAIVLKTKERKRIRLTLGESARLTLLVRQDGGEEAQAVDMDIDLAPQAKLVHGRIEAAQSAGDMASTVGVRVGQGAFYDAFVFQRTHGSASCKTDVVLAAPFAEARLGGAQVLRAQARARTEWNVFHRATHTTSRQTLKTVATDKAQGIFAGLIRMEQGAAKADGVQTARALILSQEAGVQARPSLEIYEDDVACRHGAASGDLDAEALFYLRARGIPQDEARKILVRAFLEDSFAEIQNEDLRNAVLQELDQEEGF